MSSRIEINSVSFSVKEKLVLDNVSFSADSSKDGIIGILGPSGAGKSSLLKLLNGLISPASGKISINGKDISQWDYRSLRREVGLVLQKPFLFTGSVNDNLSYGPKLRDEIKTGKQLVKLLEEVGLDEGYMQKRAEKLSTGEQQRVSLGRTLANDPSILLLDEPTSALDIASEEKIEDLLERLAGEKKLLLLVSHDPRQLKRLASRIIIIHNQRIDVDLPAKEFFELYSDGDLKEYFKNGFNSKKNRSE